MKLKNLLWSITTLLTLSACDSEFDIPDLNTGGDEEVVVTYTVKLPDAAQTRAYSDGTKAKELHYAVYEVSDETKTVGEDSENNSGESTSTTLKPTLSDNVTLIDREADIQLHLIKDRKYEIIFWAQSPSAPYTYRDDTQIVTVDYENAYSNDDDLDAFFAFEEINTNYSYGKTVSLQRAFAQLNFGTNDLAKAKEMQINVNRSTITTEVNTTLNLKTKGVSGKKKISFKLADVPAASEKFPSDNVKTYVAMNYLIAPADEEYTATVTLHVDGKFDRTFDNIPLKMNHRTNVFGDLFTNETKLKVKVLNNFDIEAWDGIVAKEKAREEGETIIQIYDAADLASICAWSNTGPDPYSGVKIQLMTDIDLGGKPWDPIGASEEIYDEDLGYGGFYGTFDGNGHCIHNLYVDLDRLQTNKPRYTEDDEGNWVSDDDEVYHYAGLFGQLSNATIKNVTIENAIIHAAPAKYEDKNDMWAGVIAGFAYKTTFENITIQGTIIVNADGSSISSGECGYVGGLIGAAGYGCKFENININVQDVSYVSCSDCDYVGGIAGMCDGNTDYRKTYQFKNVKSNLNVIAANPLGEKTKVGGLIGSIGIYTNTLTNCSCSGTVTLNNYAGSIEDGLNKYNMGIGGLVGTGILNSKYTTPTTVFTFTNCSFTGSIISNFVSGSDITDHTTTVQNNNSNWKYMGWLDGSGSSEDKSPFRSNDGYTTTE